MKLTVAIVFALVLIGSACSQSASSGDSPRDVAAARAMFEENKCATCHGQKGEGGVGPNLKSPIIMTRTVQQIENQITNGSGVMPSFKGTLTREQIHELATFVYKEIQGR